MKKKERSMYERYEKKYLNLRTTRKRLVFGRSMTLLTTLIGLMLKKPYSQILRHPRSLFHYACPHLC